MKILFICTAHNSLSQSLYLALSRSHQVTIEYALSDEQMISAVALAGPDIIICPFLTTFIPKDVFENYLTLMIHPGPPGDVGPSALDWVLLGDDGSVEDADKLLESLSTEPCSPGRSHWGLTVLQADGDFDAGPVWAFEQFPIDIDQPGLTKSALYRGPITQAAISATLAAISRIRMAPMSQQHTARALKLRTYHPYLEVNSSYAKHSVTDLQPFKGGMLRNRPLLKAAQRDFDSARHTAQHISRRIRCGDSQPGVLSKLFGKTLYVYGGIIEANMEKRKGVSLPSVAAGVLGIRNQAICISASDEKGIWITHVRRPKTKSDKALCPKVPAVFGLMELGIITAQQVDELRWNPPGDWSLSSCPTYQEVWVEFHRDSEFQRTAYLYFDFYNGAMSTDQCSHLIDAMDYILSQSTSLDPVRAVVLMGGAYFSNGIALNVIEAADDPAVESWMNINRIDDVVHYLLQEFPQRDVITVAAIRGNAAAGGVALAAACDVVVAGSSAVLNPAYRAVGLYGSEYHTLSYTGRCGAVKAKRMLRSMTPMSPLQAQAVGLVDYTFPGTGEMLDDYIRTHIDYLMKPGIFKRGGWKKNVDLTPSALATARAKELAEMSLDFWSPRSQRYHSRRFDFVRKVKASSTPLRFATHRRDYNQTLFDEEESDDFDSVKHWQDQAERQLLTALRASVLAEARLVAETDLELTERLENKAMGVANSSLTKLARAPSVSEAKDCTRSTIFSCYYQPLSIIDLPTPPESPMPGGGILDGMRAIV